MDLSQYYYFFEVVQAGSVRKAAEKLFVSPSALSRHIKKIEELHDAILFNRSSKGMELTEVGELVYQYTEQILNQRRVLVNQIHDIRKLNQGTLSYCSIEGVLNSLLLPAISQFQIDYPNIHIGGMVRSSAGVYENVAEGIADFGLAFEEENRQEVEVISHFYTNIVAVTNFNSAFLKKDEVNFDELKDIPLAMLNSQFYTRQLVDIISNKYGTSLKIIFEIDQIEILKQLIQDKNYITILPAFSTQKETQAKKLRSIEITEDSLKNIKTVLIQKKNQYKSKSLIHFTEYLQREINRISINS